MYCTKSRNRRAVLHLPAVLEPVLLTVPPAVQSPPVPMLTRRWPGLFCSCSLWVGQCQSLC